MNFLIVPGILVCSSFLISVCMFIVSKPFFISSVTVIVRAGGAIWVNPFATVLFSHFESSSTVPITEIRDVGLYEVPLSMSLLGFGMGTMLANFRMCGIVLFLRAVLNMRVSIYI